MDKTAPFPIVVLISGNGSNLQAIIDAKLPIEIKAVISNRSNAYGLERARKAHIPTEIIDHTQFSNRDTFDEALAACIKKYQPKLIVLAGFMRILGEKFIHQFEGKIINLHPSLLPKYPGLRTHEQAIQNKDCLHGCTVHYVTADLDAGPIIRQASLVVADDDTPESLQAKVHELEHRLLPESIRDIIRGQ